MNSHAAIIHPHLNSEDESMIEAFLSSCSRDRIQIDSVYDILRECNVMAWASHREVRPGRLWDRVVEKALHEASSVIVFWTKNSVESEEVLNEASVALEQSKLIPVRLEPCEIPYRFKRLHHIDLQGWDGCRENTNIWNLITCIKECSTDHGADIAYQQSFDFMVGDDCVDRNKVRCAQDRSNSDDRTTNESNL